MTTAQKSTRAKPTTNVVVGNVISVRHDSITPDPDQPRKTFDDAALKELSASLASNGLLQPISIRPDEENSTTRNKRYIIIAGERRWRAAGLLGWETIPAIIRKDLTAQETAKLQLLENIVRVDLDPVEKARAYQKMLDEDYTAKEIGESVGTTAGNINWFIKLLDAREDVLQMVSKGEVNPMSAIFMSKLSPSGQGRVLAAMNRSNLTTREVELLCNRVHEEENSEETALFTEGLLTEAQREAVTSFEGAFKSICSTLDKLQAMDKESPGAFAQGLANPSLVESQIDEVIKGLYQVRNSLRVRRIAHLPADTAAVDTAADDV